MGHSADVAAVMLALLDQPTIASRLGRLLEREPLTGRDARRLAALAALHDLGKVSHGFQRAPFGGRRESAGHIRPLVSLIFNEHGDVSVKRAWQALERVARLAVLGSLLGRNDGWEAFCAALAHHGSLPPTKDAVGDASLWQPGEDHDPREAARALVEAVLAWFPEAAEPEGLAWTSRFGHAFAGLLMLADWLGSDETVFAMAGEDGAPDGPARLAWSLPRAQTLVERRLCAPEGARAACASLAWNIPTLTGFATGSTAQQGMLVLPPPLSGGRITLIEDETGSGKTEAALIHFLHLFRAGAVDGMYFALPTRAAAIQIYGRIERRLRELLRGVAPHVVLAVPGYVSAATKDPALPDDSATWPEETPDALWASARPKRYLAACVAVGTIDQALMGALRVRHAQLRSSVLLRNLLVVDEVHATDPYMTAILLRLLKQHRCSGGHALLMSATLGSETRAMLLGPKSQEVAAPYPAIWTDDCGLILSSDRKREHKPKTVHVALCSAWRHPEHAVMLAVDAARRGARVLIIRNTVSAVIATQQALEEADATLSLAVDTPRGFVLAPHHGRYAPEDRLRLDAALEGVLGANVARRGGSVTIASQTAEQSLDIDADLLITDLCPADVLLQRIGRLHRKRAEERSFVEGFETARAVVLAPTEAELSAALTAEGGVQNPPLALGLVYPDLLGVVATRRELTASPVLSIPCDNRRLVEAATRRTGLQRLAETLGGNWPQFWGSRTGGLAAQVQAARRALIEWEAPIAPLPDLDAHIKTRLGLDDRAVDLPDGTIGPFGNEITRLTVPGRWLGATSDAAARVEMPEPGRLALRFGQQSVVYDRWGLRLLARD